MNIRQTTCCYCKQPRDFSADLHGCPESLSAQAYLAGVIGDITAIGTGQLPTSKPWNVDRHKNIQDMARSIELTGGGLKPQI